MCVEGQILLEIVRKKRRRQKIKDKSVEHTVNQIKTISNQNDFLFNELQYVDVIVDDIPLIATLDSGANAVIINKKYVSAIKRVHSQITLTSCFGERRIANVSEFSISLKAGKHKPPPGQCAREIETEILLSLRVYEFLKSESEEARSNDRIRNQVCLEDGIVGEQQIDESGCLVNSERIMDKSNLFLLKVSEAYEECSYDLSQISDIGIRRVNEKPEFLLKSEEIEKEISASEEHSESIIKWLSREYLDLFKKNTKILNGNDTDKSLDSSINEGTKIVYRN
ncbi:hypothetical protein TNCT_462081 [Trichonephila clavata]|uniref:Uncharacterized protein n=1 Tax=Trichonephila clavata TaxID=2740835 RepID=A0A8X6HN38_TRICU|nr:hypothetical protein TNCT_462081 [Trichonephila clavata]